MASLPKSWWEPGEPASVYASSMKSTPPMAFSMTLRVLGAVWPTYSATRSARPHSTRWPELTMPSSR